MSEYEIFVAALDIDDPRRRAEYLQQACGSDQELREQVEALLAARERSGQFLDVPALQQMAAGAEGDRGSTEDTRAEFPVAADEIDLSFLQASKAPDSLGRLGHYEVQQVIGRGGCGIVLKALDTRLQRVVAIKVMAPELARTSPARKRFLREARATAAIRHENVVNIYVVEEQPLPFLVMEYIEGQTLQQRLDATGPLDLSEVLRIGHQIASGLNAAHAKGLVHRDIKPANILLEAGDNRVKITDFGLARSADDASVTQTGAISGTPLYMSPEQAQGRTIDSRSDLFSLGSVLYVMSSGRPPFRAPSTVAVLMRVAKESPRPIQEIIPETPDWLVKIIAKLHAKDPAQRFSSAGEVSELLARCLAELEQHGKVEAAVELLPMPVEVVKIADEGQDSGEPPVVEQATAAPTPPPGTSPRRRRWVAAALLALAAVSGLGMTEATGVTNFHGTVIRLFSSEGTLVVEVDDPDVSVTIDGEELVIKGTGAKEIRVKPGQHEVLGRKAGEVVQRKLVTVTRNGRRLVHISREFKRIAGAAGSEKTDHGIPFFNGKDLTGWKGLDGLWRVEDKAIVGVTRPEQKFNTCLCSEKEYQDFELRFQVRLKDGMGNSGVQIRSKVFDPNSFRVVGPQCDIGAQYWGNLYHERAGNETMKAAPPDVVNRVLKPNEFNDYFIRCVGTHVTIKLNGETTVDDDFPEMPAKGVIAWQLHDGPSMEVVFRNIQFTVLNGADDRGFTPLFNGKTLEGWVTESGDLRNWKVVDGAITCNGNADYLYTDRDDFADFHLKAEVRINEVGNSGVYFRAGMPVRVIGDYEAQLSNNPGQGDKTGSLYGLVQVSEKLVAADQWFTCEIIAEGQHIQVLIDGKRTANYADQRSDQRREGHIVLQHYDNKTRVQFRKIEIKELKPASPPVDRNGITTEERKALEWVLAHGGFLDLSVNGEQTTFPFGGPVARQPVSPPQPESRPYNA